MNAIFSIIFSIIKKLSLRFCNDSDQGEYCDYYCVRMGSLLISFTDQYSFSTEQVHAQLDIFNRVFSFSISTADGELFKHSECWNVEACPF